jgi:hypothetical protein
MQKHVLWLGWLGVAVVLALAPAAAQNRAKLVPASGPVGRVTVEQPLAGEWTYRSFINTADFIGIDPNRALDLIFGEGVVTFETPSSAALTGTFDMGGGFVLDLVGTIHPAAQGAPLTFEIVEADAPTRRRRAGSTTTTRTWRIHGRIRFRLWSAA